MKLKELLEKFDNPNTYTRINAENLETICEGKLYDMASKKEFSDQEVIAFGYYDDVLCVRLAIEWHVKEFDSLEELKNNQDLHAMGRYCWEKVMLKGKPVYACTTNQQYEDILWGGTYEMLTEFNQHFDIPDAPSGELCSEVRDLILERLQEQGIELVDVYDEY